MIPTFVTALSLLAPSASAQSTPKLRLQLQPVAGVSLDRGTSYLTNVIFNGCGSTPSVETVEAPVNLLYEVLIDDPADGSCQVTLNFAVDFVMEGMESAEAFLAASANRQITVLLGSGESALLTLPNTPLVLEGIYGGNPDMVKLSITRDPPS